MKKIPPTEKISIFALVLLITGAIDSIRNLATPALFGSSLIFFFIFAAIIFLIPVALVSAELSSTFSKEEGGIFSWVNNAFGENWAFLSIWLQWINTIVWYPTILSFIGGTLGYLINPTLALNKYYLIMVNLIIFWGLTLLGLKGLRVSARFASFCAIFGMIVPMVLIIILGLIWILQGNALAIQFDLTHMIPKWQDINSWISLTAIMTAFLGMELACVHVRNVDNPQKNFPKAMLFSVILILVTMICGSLAIAVVLPAAKINLVNGVMDAFYTFFKAFNITYLLIPVVLLLLLGSLGGMINWIISPAKGLLVASNYGFFPHWFYHTNKHGVASRILILQAILVTLLCSAFLIFPTINAIYWLFTDLSTELYIIMYIILFIAAIRLKSKYKNLHRPFKIPGGSIGYYLTCFIGLIGCVFTLIIGFYPPEQAISLGSVLRFRLVFIGGILLMLIPLVILYLRKYLTVTKNRELNAKIFK